jgi:hypothetical protein
MTRATGEPLRFCTSRVIGGMQPKGNWAGRGGSPVVRRRGKQTRSARAGGQDKPFESAPAGRTVGVAPGPHHTSFPNPHSPPSGQLPRIRPGLFFHAVTRNGASPTCDGRPGCVPPKARPGHPNSLNDARDDNAKRLATDRRVVSFIGCFVHSPEAMERSKSCPRYRVPTKHCLGRDGKSIPRVAA